ncbi:MAG: 2-C-methyl-D-erythritol 4-phosphate cytidylyltransferase [Ktedonobacteraceae bacterium]
MTRKRSSSQRVVAIVLGAGQGTRMGYQINKVFLPLNGKPIIIYAIETFERCPGVDEIILVAAAGEEEQLAKLARYANCDKVRHVVRGGASRHASELCALEVLRPDIEAGNVEIVLIHDGARPFISVEKVERLISKAREEGGAILATPLQEEERIAEVNGENYVQRSFEGEQAWKAQTPQAFQAPLLLKAYDEAKRNLFHGTDTAASVELIGGHVAIVESDAINLKITTAHDLFLAERLSNYRRF